MGREMASCAQEDVLSSHSPEAYVLRTVYFVREIPFVFDDRQRGFTLTCGMGHS